MTHSILAPSSAAVWAPPNGCRAAPLMGAKYPETEESLAAREGTASHWVAECLLTQGEVAVGSVAPNGVVITEEIYEAAEVYWDYLGEKLVAVEERVEMPDIHPDCFGTPDAWYGTRGQNQLNIVDYKYGLRRVEAFENWQLALYASGLIRNLGPAHRVDTVVFHIVQPRAFGSSGPVDTWTTTPGELRAMWNIAAGAAEEVLSGKAVARSGEHCQYCPARFDCPAAIKGGAGLYQAAAEAAPFELSGEQVGVQLGLIQAAIAQLKAIETGSEARLEALLNAGEVIPGWELRGGRGSTVWTKSNKEVAKMGELLGTDLVSKVKTPKQAAKAGLPPDLVSACSAEKPGGLKLTKTNETRLRKLFS